jgi:hypothetical protein
MTRNEDYKERLLAELRALAERNAAEAPRQPASRRAIAGRPKIALAGIVGGACVASATIAFTGGDGGGTAAYAVEPHDDGSVSVEIRRLEDAAGLERELRAAGVPAEVDFLPLAEACREPRFEPAPTRELKLLGGMPVPMTVGEVTTGPSEPQLERGLRRMLSFTVHAGDLKTGETLVITSRKGPHPRAERPQTMTSVTFAVAQGPVAPCDPVPARAPNLESEDDAADRRRRG